MIVLYCALLFFVVGLFFVFQERDTLDTKIAHLFSITVCGAVFGLFIMGLLMNTNHTLIPCNEKVYQIEQFPRQEEYVLYYNDEFILRQKDKNNNIKIKKYQFIKIITGVDEPTVKIVEKDYSNKILRHLLLKPLKVEYIISLPASKKIVPVQEVKTYEEYS